MDGADQSAEKASAAKLSAIKENLDELLDKEATCCNLATD